MSRVRLFLAAISIIFTAVFTARGENVFSQYAGSESCEDCHAEEFSQWKNSHHGLAERLVDPAADKKAFAAAQGLPDEAEIRAAARVIGNDPLRQFLVAFPGGRFQTLETSYDPRSNQWFNVNGTENRQPGEWGHWTGRGANWNFMCASCHNTRLQKNYAATTDDYRTTMAEMSVGCEACHGPLRAHNEWQKKFDKTAAKDPTLAKLSRAQVLDNCGQCHSRRAELTGDFAPGDNFHDRFDLDMVDDSDLYFPDGQVHEEDYEYASFLGSKMHAAGVACVNCHNPHTAKIKLPGNWLCLQCHGGGNPTAPKIDPVAHSHHQVRGYDADGKWIETDLTKFASQNFPETGGECVNCHMPQTVYMQRHWRHDHGFTIPDPLLTKELGIPNACNRCHQDKGADWALAATQKWFGTNMDRVLGARRKRTRAIALARDGNSASVEPLLKFLDGNETSYWRAAIINQLSPWSENPDVQAALRKNLSDTNALVRSKAAHALDASAQNLAPATVAALSARLDDPVRAVRIAAAWSLRGGLDLDSRAGTDLKNFLDENADEPAGQMQLGEFFVARSDLTNALVHFQKAVAWDKNSAPFHRELALTYNLLNQNSNAVAELRAAVRLNPRDAEFHYELALAWNESGDLDATVVELEQATRLNPHFTLAWYNLGLARAKRGDFSNARAAVQRALEIQPDLVAAQNLLRQLGDVRPAP